MRRTLGLLLLAVTLAATSACSGPDGQRAQELLTQADQALEQVRSLRFSARIWTEQQGATPSFSLRLDGGGYAKGKRAGDFFVDVAIDGLPAGDVSVVSRGGTMFVRAGAGWTSVPVPAGAGAGAADPLAGFDFSRYITGVQVAEGLLVGGEPTAKITGVIDTAALFEGLLGQLGGLSELGAAPVPRLSEHLGDTRVVLWISEVTHLPVRGLVDLAVTDPNGERIELHVDFALSGIDERVRIPNPA